MSALTFKENKHPQKRNPDYGDHRSSGFCVYGIASGRRGAVKSEVSGKVQQPKVTAFYF